MYLFYFLLSHREKFLRQGGGGAQPNISKEKIVNTHIPEQKRILQKIEALFVAIDKIAEEL